MHDLSKPIPLNSLSAEAQRAVSGAMKSMAARGLAPLADPRDLLTVLFQLSTDNESTIRSSATKTARGLPENLTVGALAREDLDPKVLHFFAAILPRDSLAVARIILNPVTAGETIADLGRRASEREVNLIVANEERMLRVPAIIGSIYQNKNSLQSVVDRTVELAIRNGVRVPGIAAWEELVNELMSKGADEAEDEAEVDPVELGALDRLVRRYMNLGDDEAIPNPQAVHGLTVMTQMRIASNGPSMLRNMLLRSRKTPVAMAAIKGPKVTEADAAKHAGNLSLGEEVIRYIATRREWTKNYQVKTALVNNPKCPLPTSMKLMPFLRERELAQLGRSRNVPSALRAQARKMSQTRKGGKGQKR